MDAWDDAFGASPDRDPDFGPDERSGQPPLTMEERAGVLDDLAELEVFRTLLEPTGVKGIVVDCPDCDEEHHVDWALMQANLRQLLDEAQSAKADLEKQAGRKGKKVSRKARKKAEIARKEADKRRKEARKVAAQGRRAGQGRRASGFALLGNREDPSCPRDAPCS